MNDCNFSKDIQDKTSKQEEEAYSLKNSSIKESLTESLIKLNNDIVLTNNSKDVLINQDNDINNVFQDHNNQCDETNQLKKEQSRDYLEVPEQRQRLKLKDTS